MPTSERAYEWPTTPEPAPVFHCDYIGSFTGKCCANDAPGHGDREHYTAASDCGDRHDATEADCERGMR